MLRSILKRQIDGFERAWSYDASYMRDLLAASVPSFLRFSLVTGLPDRRAAPAAALATAGIVGTLAEDCGPCTQISTDMARASGVAPKVLRAILAGDLDGMGQDAALAYQFARASLARDLEAADPLRDEIVRRWGQKGLVAIALSLTAARMYPTLKYALGHGKTCSRVVVDGTAVVPPRLAA